MSKSLLSPITGLFQPPLPHWACEFTSQHVIVAGTDSRRARIVGRAMVDAPPGLVAGSLSDPNFGDASAILGSIQNGLAQAGFKGAEVGVVIPDDAAKIAFLTADNLPERHEDRESFIRWKLKKNMPFDVDRAQVAFRVIGPHDGPAAAAVDVVVALSPREVIDEYVGLMENLDIHAGFVIPSTLAALNLLQPSAEDTLFVKIAPRSITTSVFRNQRLKFFRRVSETSIHEAVYPTIMYYQDKLMGGGIQRIVVCAYDDSAGDVLTELHEKFGVPAYELEPRGVDDVFKPALGAVGLVMQ